jgi:hypothetical protein
LVWGAELFFDATKVRADADLDSLVPRFYYDARAHLAQVFAGDPAPTGEAAGEGADEPASHDLFH